MGGAHAKPGTGRGREHEPSDRPGGPARREVREWGDGTCEELPPAVIQLLLDKFEVGDEIEIQFDDKEWYPADLTRIPSDESECEQDTYLTGRRRLPGRGDSLKHYFWMMQHAYSGSETLTCERIEFFLGRGQSML